MNKTVHLSNLGGFPFTQDTLAFMQDSYRGGLSAMAEMAGEKTIVSGVNVVGSVVGNGWIVFEGELIPFIGGGLAADVVITTTTTKRTFEDGAEYDAYSTKTATCGSPGDFPFAQLTRLSTLKADRWQTGDLKMINCDAAYIAANFDGNGFGINERAGWKISNVMAGRTPVGYDPTDGDFAIGAVGGAKTHTLTAPELAPHNHSISTRSGVGSTVGNTLSNYDTANDVADVNTASTGGGQPHNNMQPYKVVLFIEKL